MDFFRKPRPIPPDGAVAGNGLQKSERGKELEFPNPGEFLPELGEGSHPDLGADFRLVMDVGKGLSAIGADQEQVKALFLDLLVWARKAMPREQMFSMSARNVMRVMKKPGGEDPFETCTRRFVQFSLKVSPFCPLSEEGLPKGLASIGTALKKLGGEIWLEAGYGGKTSFNFILPAAAKSLPEEHVLRSETKIVAVCRWWRSNRRIDPVEKVPAVLRRWLGVGGKAEESEEEP